MQRIILPVSAAPPHARAPDTGAKSGADGPGGLFGMLLSAQVANVGTSKGIGGKKAEDGLNPMAALLLSALVQGSIFNQGNTVTEEKTQGSQQAAASAAASGGAVAAPAELFPGSQSAALGRLMEAHPQFAGELGRLLALAEAGGAAGSAPEKLDALMRQASQGGEAARALGEIRRLFAELLGSDAAGAEAARRGAAQEQPAAQGAEAGAMRAPAGAGMVPPAEDARNPRAEIRPGEAQAEANIAQPVRGAPGEAQAENAGETLAGRPEAGPAGKARPATEREAAESFFAPKAVQGYETAAAAERGERAELPGAASAQRAFDDIVDRIAMMKDAARSQMEISLKPEFLGKVVIRLSMDDGGLVAKIAASNPQVQDAFLGQATALQASLESQGLRDVRVVVTSSSVPDASLQQQAERRGQEQRERGRRPMAVDAAQPAAEAGPAAAYEWYWRSGTIDYLA